MSDKKFSNIYDDDNIPDIDLGKDKNQEEKNNVKDKYKNVEPLPESSRPRQDGPGGN